MEENSSEPDNADLLFYLPTSLACLSPIANMALAEIYMFGKTHVF